MDSENPNCSQPSLVAPLPPEKEKESFFDASAFTSEEVKHLNETLRRRRERWGNLTVRRAFFRCPWPCTRRQYEQYRNRAIERWIENEAKGGLELKSKVAVDVRKRRVATDYSGDWASATLLDQVEIPVAALFQVRKVTPIRIEVPVHERN